MEQKNNQNFSTLTKELLTSEDVINLLDEIGEIEGKIYKDKNFDFSSISDKYSPELVQTLNELSKGPFKGGRKEEALGAVKGYLNSIPVVKITFAFIPSRDFLKKVQGLLVEQLGEFVLVNRTINEELIGGIIFEYAGNYRDFTVSSNLTSFFKDDTQVSSLLYKTNPQ